MRAHRIAIIGLGKIARDQHVPVIRASPAFELVAAASRSATPDEDVPRTFQDHRAMLREVPEIDAVAICTPPQVRHAIACDALAAGKHVLLEKPPAATLSELADLAERAQRAGRVLFTAWHAQHNRGVEEARAILAGETVAGLEVAWKEDVRRWHPGQGWIWEAGGFGVFDPGINALSIVTRILPGPVFVRGADLVFPANKDAPIAATLALSPGPPEARGRAEFDWRQTGAQTWEIRVETTAGTRLALTNGGTRLERDGRVLVDEPAAEYQGIYRRFDALLREGRGEVDAAPFRLAADAFLVGRRQTTDPFQD